jgi:hypothetical protein
MSGFHYHEFQALNRLLDAAPQKVLRQISIRAGITAAGAWAFNPQGNRTSDLGEELCEIGVLPTGPFDFDTQGALGGFLGQEIKGHMAQDGEVMWAVVAAISGIVLIHYPMSSS